jgi:hypothetical protein
MKDAISRVTSAALRMAIDGHSQMHSQMHSQISLSDLNLRCTLRSHSQMHSQMHSQISLSDLTLDALQISLSARTGAF